MLPGHDDPQPALTGQPLHKGRIEFPRGRFRHAAMADALPAFGLHREHARIEGVGRFSGSGQASREGDAAAGRLSRGFPEFCAVVGGAP